MEISKCIENALSEKSKLNDDILAIPGMSSRFNRHLLNNLGAEFDKFNYLEIGIHKGSTFISSLYKNNFVDVWAIDNWSLYENQSVCFLDNCDKYHIPVYFISADCFTVDTKNIRDINFYLYDGDHSVENTAQGLKYFYDCFAGEFLFVVDDYDWDSVSQGVKMGIKKCGFKIKYENYLESHITNNINGWWNGLGIFILTKL